MRKITCLMAMIVLFIGTSLQALALPFEVSDAPVDGVWAANTKWYVININQGTPKRDYYMSGSYVTSSGQLLMNNSTYPSNRSGYWCLVGDEANGYTFYNCATGQVLGMSLAGVVDNDSEAKLYDAGTTAAVTKFDFVQSDKGSDWWCFKEHGTTMRYACQNQQASNRLAFWTDTRAVTGWSDTDHGDDGAAFKFTEVEVPVEFDVTVNYTLDGTLIGTKSWTLASGSSFPTTSVVTPPSYVDCTMPEFPETITESATYEVVTTTKATSPFKFSKTLDAAKWVTMKLLFKNDNPQTYESGRWIIGNASNQTNLTDNVSVTEDNYGYYLWAFVGDWYNGYKVYPKGNTNKVLGVSSNTWNNDANKSTRHVTLDDPTEDAGLCTWTVVNWDGTVQGDDTKEGSYSLLLKNTSHTNVYLGDHTADSWLSTWLSDAGNRVNHGRIKFADPLPIYLPIAQAVYADAGKLGYPKESSLAAVGLNTVLTSATSSFEELLGHVQNFKESTDVVLPTDGKAYTIKAHFVGSDKYVALGADKLATSEIEGATFICHEVSTGVFTFVNNNGTFFNKIGNLVAYSNLTDFTLSHHIADDLDLVYGTFSFRDSDYKNLTLNGTTFQQGHEGISESSTTAFILEETTYANEPTMTVATGVEGVDENKKIATFSAPFDFTLPAGIDAYIVKQTPTGETATLELLASAGDVVAANTGVILLGKTDATKVLMVPATTKGVSDAASLLGHSAGAPVDVVTAGTNYILAKNSDGNIVFSKALEGADHNKNLSMNKAYLQLGGLGVNQFKLDFGGTTTAIEGITTEADAANAPVYDLSGRRIAAPTHRGIYIRNGKKFMVK